MPVGRNMALCPDCAENLKDIRKVVFVGYLEGKRTCGECGKKQRCDEYTVSRLDGSQGKGGGEDGTRMCGEKS